MRVAFSIGLSLLGIAGLALSAAETLPSRETYGPIPDNESEPGKWSIATYAGPVTYTRFNEIVRLQTDFRSSYVAALAAGRKLTAHGELAQWEIEGQVTRHWGKQDHSEINAALLLRWKGFPWDDYLRTSIALGIGPSIALATPALEKGRHGEASRRLAFMPFEITAAPPDSQNWEIFTRVHHRSGVFGVVSDSSGSNFVTGGLRVRF